MRFKKQKVALDVDGVLADVVKVMLKMRKEKGFHYTSYDPGEYPGPDKIFLGLDNDGFEKMYNHLLINRWQEIKSTVREELLSTFCDNFDVTILTSRYSNTLLALKKWLRKNFPNLALDPV